jgi:eukaryotic-like serine/threonine-protein kinase
MADYTGKQLGNYRLFRSLGRGASAEVYLGEHIHLGTFAAIKVLSGLIEGCRSDDFRGEAQIIAYLRHPHIVRVLDFGVESNLPFLVMDYVPNGTMRQRYPQGTILPFSAVLSYAKQIAQALQYAHDHKITHRDVKPENMLLDINDQVLLSDFGISAIEHTTSPLTTLKRVSIGQAGTPIYMAPEQIQGNPHFASDQYALAVVVYEWMCGARPFSGDLLAVMYQHVHTQPPSLRETLSTILPGIEQVILKALAKDPQQRYATILDFAKALEEAVQMDIGLTFLRRLPPASVSPPLIAAAPIQPTVFQLESDSAIRARPRPAPAKSIRLAQQRHGLAPHWIVLLLGLACILIAGSFAFATALSRNHAQATVPAPVNTYNAAVANGMMLGYNAQHTRVDPYEKIITPDNFSLLQKKWSRPTGGTIMSSPTEANGIVYISSNGNTHVIKGNGYFYAFNAKTGAMVWVPVLIGSSDAGNAPTVANSVVYMGAPDKYLYAFYASTGKLKWKKPTGGRIGSSPTLVDGVIYIGSDDGYLYAFRASDGDQLKKISVNPHFPIRSSPAVSTDGKAVYVGSDDGGIYAIDTSSYTVQWLIRTGSPVRSTPAVYNNEIYVGSNDGYLYAINPGGSLAWKSLTGGKIESSPAVYNGVVYVGSDDGYLYAFNAEANTANCERQMCKPIWHGYPGVSRQPIKSSPTIANGVLFFGSDDGNLYAYNISGCKSTSCIPKDEWSYPIAGNIDSSPVVANGYVYIGSDDKNDPNNGYLYAFGL